MDTLPLSPVTFKAVLKNDLAALSKLTVKDCRPILPYLARMCLNNNMCDLFKDRTELMRLLCENEPVNFITPLLSIDFSLLSQEIITEVKSRSLKLEPARKISSLDFKTAIHLKFEKSEPVSKIKILLNELFLIYEFQKKSGSYFVTSELFDPEIYLNEICDLLSITIMECPSAVELLDIVKFLLHVKNGPRIICVLVANMPHRFKEVCQFLIQLDEKPEDNKDSGKVRTDTLRMLCKLNYYQALWVRDKCVEHCRLAALTVFITFDYQGRHPKHHHNNDINQFLLSVLLSHDQKVNTWFSSYIYNSQKESGQMSEGFKLLQMRLGKGLKKIAHKCSDNKIKSSKLLKASSLVRVYCALMEMAKYQLQGKEMSHIVKILTARPPFTLSGSSFMSLGLSVFITMPSLLLDRTHVDSVIQWIKWFLQEGTYTESSSSFEEMLLLVAVLFHSNQLLAICDLAYSKLAMKISVHNSTLLPLQKIFTEEIFTEKAVTLYAANVPVTINLNANISGFLPLHCIYHLLKTEAFKKHKVSVKDWIYRQICNSVAPLHPMLPHVVELYVRSLLIPSTVAAENFVDNPFSEQDISKAFSEFMCVSSSAQKDVAMADSSCPSPSLTSLLLLTYYVLLYEDVRVSNMSKIISQGRKVESYNDSFLSGLPIRYILQNVQADQGSYAELFPSLLRLLVKNFPHLSLIPDWIESDENYQESLSMNQNTMEINKDSIIKAFNKAKTFPSSLRKLLEELSQLPANNLWEYSEVIVEQIKNILDDGILRSIQDMYKNVWLLLNKYLPEKVWVMTVNALHVNCTLPFKVEDIMFNPLLVVRCDARVFRCAPVLDILLRVLQGSLAMSKNYFSKPLRVFQSVPGEEEASSLIAEYESHQSHLIAFQESATVQILLKSCLETEEDKSKAYMQWALREVRGIICSYLDSKFISDPFLLKLVHFQGYSHDLLPVTVLAIPSLHNCLDFIHELLSKPHLDKQMFAIDLVSHIALKYRTPESYNAACICIDLVKTFPAVLSSEEQAETFSIILPSLIRLSKACPTQVNDILSFLMGLVSNVHSTSISSSGADCELNILSSGSNLCKDVEEAISEILAQAVNNHIY